MSNFLSENTPPHSQQNSIEELIQQQPFFNAFFAGSKTGMLVLDDQLRYVRINEALAEINGLPVADHIGRSLYEVLPNIASTLGSMLQNVIETGEGIFDYELVGETPKAPGVTRYWLGSYYPLFDPQHQVFGIGGIIIEISDRKQAEKALCESEERFRSLMEASAQIVWTANAEGELVTEQPTWTAFTGQNFKQYTGWGWLETIHPDDRSYLAEKWSDAVTNRSLYESEFRMRRFDGEYRYMSCRGIPILEKDGNIREWVGANTDITERKQTEIALKQSEERYRSLIKATSQMVWKTDTEGEILDLGDWGAYTGQSQSEMENMGWIEAIHPEDREQTAQIWMRALETKSLYETEFRVRSASGDYRYFAVKGIPLLNADGSVREWMGTCTDIHDRKQAELDLKISELRYRSLVMATTQIPWNTNAEGRCRDIPEWRAFTGQTIEEVINFGWLEAIHPEDREKTFQIWMQCVETKTPFETEYRIRAIDGSYRYFVARGVPLLNEDGTIVEWMGTCTDIHDRKQAELDLKVSELRYRSLVMAMTQIPWNTDPEGRCRDMPEWRAYTGQTVEEVINFGWLDALHPEDGEKTFQIWMQCVETKTVFEAEYRIRAANGSYRYFVARGVPLLNEDGTIAEWIGTCTDIHDRKQAELDLKLSELRYRSLVMATTQLPWATDVDGRVTDMPEWRAFTGQTVAEVAEFGWLNALHPEDRERTGQIWMRAVETKTLYETEYRIRAADGSYRYFVSRGVPVLTEDGCIREWIGACTDIDDRKQAEIALQISEERYRSLISATSQIIWLTDAEGRVTEDLPTWRAYTGQTKAESLGFGWLKAIHPDDEERTSLLWMEAVQTKTVFDSEYRARGADGNYRYFVSRGVPILNEEGTIREWIGTCTDIHDRKLAEQKVRQTLDLLDLASDAIIIRDMSDRITYWNRGAEILYGWSRQEVVGQYIHTFLQTTFPKPLEQVLGDFFQQGTWEGEIEHITRDGRHIIVASRWTLQRDEIGRPLAQLEINNDITQQKLAQLALAQAKEAAETASRAKSEFLANMSHELRTPLNGILGYAQVLQRSKAIHGEERSRVDVIYQCGSHLLTLINDILDLSKIEAQKVELMPTDFHFPAFLQGVAEMCRVRAELKGIQFHYQFASELPVGICADEKRLRQVLINLLSNAIKFTDSGSVTFTITYAAEGKIRFEVRDTGVGIATEQIQAIFQPFEQVGDTKRQTEGTGLGLAISQRIVELMNSQIQVQSQVGVGSIFWFDVSLPAALEWVKTAQTNRYGQIIGIKNSRPKVLVIDDKWENRSVVNNLLTPIGFDVFEALDGEEGWQKTCQIQPDLVITDLLMPKVDGFELLKRIRTSSLFKELIVIVSSASVFEADQYRSLDAGGNTFLPKPIQASELLEKVQQYLHLEWIYEDLETSNQSELDNVEIVAPPTEELEVLYELAMKGNFKGIIRQATLLEEQDRKYVPFAKQLYQMAKEFQDEKILAFIESYQ